MMSWFASILGLVLTLAGAAALAASIDLRATDLGLQYAVCGSVAVSGGFITLAIAALIRRVDAMARQPAPHPEYVYYPTSPPAAPAPPIEAYAPADSRGDAPAETASATIEEPINENRAGHLPSFADVEAPEPPATLVGRYSAGGAHYMIYSDGTIEAETDRGAMKFASMDEFKTFLGARRG
jgi:hypothetical protein